MNKGGPIIIIEDDIDDQLLLGEAFAELGISSEFFFSATAKRLSPT